MKEINTDFYVPLVTLKLCKEKLVPYGLEGRFCLPECIAKIGRTIIGDADKECMLVVSLDAKCHPLAVECIAVGRCNNARVEMRDVIKSTLLSNATAIVLLHNHPSSDITPSEEDLSFTKRVKEATDFVGMTLLDHVIIGSCNEEFYSMKESEEWEMIQDEREHLANRM